MQVILKVFISVFCLWSVTAAAFDNKIALYGKAKYEDGFSSFSYVNPDAVKGGRLVMPEYGGFDNFNPFIFKGSASGTVADLIAHCKKICTREKLRRFSFRRTRKICRWQPDFSR